MSLPITKIVVHCSATRNGKSIKQPGKNAAQVIDGWHKQRGFKRQLSSQRAFNPHLSSIVITLSLMWTAQSEPVAKWAKLVHTLRGTTKIQWGFA
ncbi:predicted coding region HI1493 [Haemophilus influenzae Rd KW20]|uniref:Uncharacterized protein HI_1493 n=1 Tax=Haemophilus influenzae (strain ATCC 51907 / DSM 11121 / KW20 / Rd) TaxID=71421 RepID=Y1493_HAEIN|nr:RecName: Full=Uncharacterized protein HI_1493 [Haemophilus influenzae Rd KW20]AAC23145.1 predicted coding region HI1493 [Haemophilus influenzae Rd KW20]